MPGSRILLLTSSLQQPASQPASTKQQQAAQQKPIGPASQTLVISGSKLLFQLDLASCPAPINCKGLHLFVFANLLTIPTPTRKTVACVVRLRGICPYPHIAEMKFANKHKHGVKRGIHRMDWTMRIDNYLILGVGPWGGLERIRGKGKAPNALHTYLGSRTTQPPPLTHKY